MTKHGVVLGPEDAVVAAAARRFSFPPPRTAADSCRKLAAQVDLGAAAVMGSWLDSMKASSPRHRLMAPLPGAAADAEHDDWMASRRKAPSMNAKVDAITDAVETAIVRGNNHPGGVRRFILQSAIRRALRDIANCRIAPRRFHGAGPNADGHPTPPRPVPRSSRLEYATGVYPSHGPAMFVRRVGATPESSPMPSSLPRLSSALLPPPPPLSSSTALSLPWNGGGGTMAGRRGAPPLLDSSNDATPAWPPGFAYDLDIVFPEPALTPLRTPSYADVAANRSEGPRSTIGAGRLPTGPAIGAGFASSSNEGEAVPRR